MMQPLNIYLIMFMTSVGAVIGFCSNYTDARKISAESLVSSVAWGVVGAVQGSVIMFILTGLAVKTGVLIEGL